MFARFFESEKKAAPIKTEHFFHAKKLIENFLQDNAGVLPFEIRKFLNMIKNTLTDITDICSHRLAYGISHNTISADDYQNEYASIEKSTDQLMAFIAAEKTDYINNPINNPTLNMSYLELLTHVDQCCNNIKKHLSDAKQAVAGGALHSLEEMKQVCELFHGTCHLFTQSLHPLLGMSGGLCAGLVSDWSIEEGRATQTFLKIDDDTFTFQEQCADRFSVWTDSFTHINQLDKILEDISPHKIYRLRFESKNGAHAIGVRRIQHGQGIELFDPNYGVFSFAKAEHFKLWLPFLILKYEQDGSLNYLSQTAFIPRKFHLAAIHNQQMNTLVAEPVDHKNSSEDLLAGINQLFIKIDEILKNEIIFRMAHFSMKSKKLNYFEIQAQFEKCLSSYIQLIEDPALLAEVKKTIQAHNNDDIFSATFKERAMQDLHYEEYKESNLGAGYSWINRKLSLFDYCNQMIDARLNILQPQAVEEADFFAGVKSYFNFS